MLDGLVEGVERVGVEISIGCVRLFIPHTKIPKNWEYLEAKQVFQNVEDSALTIERGRLLRFRVLNISIKGSKL